MIVSYLGANITRLKLFLKKNEIFKTLSSSENLLGTTKIDATHTTLQPGSYLHFKVNKIIMNDIQTRTVAKSTLIISNERGVHYFMSLNTSC